MADAQTLIDLDALHQAILDSISTRFPHIVSVDDYRDERKLPSAVNIPACFVELVELEPSEDDDPGTEQVAAYANFEAHLLISFRTPDAKRAIRRLVGDFLVHLRKQRWGLPVGPAIPGRAYADPFHPHLDQFEIWTVEWRQIIHLGDTVWKNDGIIPEPYLGFAPDIGPGHEDDYIPMQGVPEL